MKIGLFFGLFFFVFSHSGHACFPSSKPPSAEQLSALYSAIRDSDLTDLERGLAFEQIMQTDSEFARTEALKAALLPHNEALRGIALRCRFLRAKTLRVRSLPFSEANELRPNLTDEASQLVEQGFVISLVISSVDIEHGCAGIDCSHCQDNRHDKVSDLVVSFVLGGDHGRFEMQTEGRLIGELYTRNRNTFNAIETIPAELFID